MSDLITIPAEDNFETTLTQSRNGGVGDVLVNYVPTSTIATGEKSYIVVNAGKSNMQVARVSGWASSPSKKFIVDSITVDEGNATAYTQKSHSANSTVRFSNNYQFWKDIQTAVNSKLDKGNFSTSGSKITATGNMSFKDDNNVELTLSQIASGGGADQKVAITTNDTTTGTLDTKLTVGAGITKTVVNPGANETMRLDPDTNVLATKTYVDSKEASDLSNSDYIAGEAMLQGDSMFPETAPAYAQATSVANIGDVSANTRYAFPIFGTGLPMTTVNLGLKKFVSPSVDLKLRIETNNAGSPSGTIFPTTTETTIATSGLTTSIVDKTITLAQSITIPLGTMVRGVLYAGTYGSETVNGTNYFGVAYSTNDTTTRGSKVWNGSSWQFLPLVISLLANQPTTNSASVSTSGGVKFSVDSNILLSSVTKVAACNATRCRLLDSGGTLLQTGTVVGSTATFSYPLVAGIQYKVEWDNSGSVYTRYFTNTGTNPSTVNGVTILSSSISGTDNASIAINVESISTGGIGNKFTYITGTGIQSTVLSKTDADYTYKLPDIPRLATKAYNAGELVKYDFGGISKTVTGTKGDTKYISNTPGQLSNSAGTNSRKVGKIVNDNQLRINPITL